MVGAIHIRHRAISFRHILRSGGRYDRIRRLSSHRWLRYSGNQARKEIIRDALIGLLVLIGSYIILQTVNPETLALKALKVPVVKNIPAEEGDAPAVVQEQKRAFPKADPSIKDRKTLCHPADPSSFPKRYVEHTRQARVAASSARTCAMAVNL